MKKFLCVKFVSQNSTDIVSHKWMCDLTFCKWPPSRFSNEQIQEMSKIHFVPGAEWKKYKCQIVCEASKFKVMINKSIYCTI